MDKIFLEVCSRIKEIEKGYSDHPSDSGGKTRWGITEWLARQYGFEGDMDSLSWEKARDIYYQEYWLKNRYNEIKDRRIAGEVMEQAINLPAVDFRGRKVLKANLNLQKSYNLIAEEEITVDGLIGPETLGAINSCVEIVALFNVMNGYQAKHYIELTERRASQKDFIKGWFKRITIRKR